MYPALVEFFGPVYVESLCVEHDAAIGAARRLAELVGRAPRGGAEREATEVLARGLLPHVSDCEGLSIMVERLPEREVERILDRRRLARAQALDLLRWADEARLRPSPAWAEGRPAAAAAPAPPTRRPVPPPGAGASAASPRGRARGRRGAARPPCGPRRPLGPSPRSPASVSSSSPRSTWITAGREAVCSESSSPAAKPNTTTLTSSSAWSVRLSVPAAGISMNPATSGSTWKGVAVMILSSGDSGVAAGARPRVGVAVTPRTRGQMATAKARAARAGSTAATPSSTSHTAAPRPRSDSGSASTRSSSPALSSPKASHPTSRPGRRPAIFGNIQKATPKMTSSRKPTSSRCVCSTGQAAPGP